MSTEPITGLTYQEAGSLQPDVLQNAELNYYGAWLNCAVLTVGDAAPPVSPANGDCYIVGTGTGAWATHDDELAVYRDGWQFYAPKEGVAVKDLATGDDYEFVAAAWAVKAGGGSGTAAGTSIIDAGGHFTATDVEGALQELGTAIGGGGDMEKLAEVLVTGAAVTDIDFTSLDLSTDRFYLIKAFVVPGAGGGHSISAFYNADTTATNYNSQLLYGLGATAAAAAGNTALVHFNNAMPDTSNTYSFDVSLSQYTGTKPCAQAQGVGLHTTGAPFSVVYSQRRNNTANVTSIKLRNSIASGFGIGTLVRLYRMN